jgi:hypothetical protein
MCRRRIFSWSAIASRSIYNLIVFETWQLILTSYRPLMHTVLFRRLLLRCTLPLAMPQSYGALLELSTERRRDVMGAILIQITRLSALKIPSLSNPRSTIPIPHSPYPSLIPIGIHQGRFSLRPGAKAGMACALCRPVPQARCKRYLSTGSSSVPTQTPRRAMLYGEPQT